jgi:hypothetical protein
MVTKKKRSVLDKSMRTANVNWKSTGTHRQAGRVYQRLYEDNIEGKNPMSFLPMTAKYEDVQQTLESE